MKDQINKLINDYHQREADKKGYRYFNQDYVTSEILEDKQLVKDIIDLARELAPINKLVKQG